MGKITMYRLVLYYLAALVLFAAILSALSFLPYNPTDIVSNALFFLIICYASNKLFARIFKVSTNHESSYITALILSLIFGPVPLTENFFLLAVVGTAAMASKYLLVIHKKHILNPAAFAVLFSGIFLDRGASWWVGSFAMSPLVIIGGLLILYKIKRFRLVASFLVIYLLLSGTPGTLIYSPILFFSFVMLVEPFTSPIKSSPQIIYAAFTAFIFIIYQALFKDIPYTLELALVTGNLYAYFVNKNFAVNFKFIEARKIARDTYEFVFEPAKIFSFKPGQFLEWTLSHKKTDSRGNRRFFTISSSPTEKLVTLTTKIIKGSSSFKKALLKVKKGDTITVSNLRGEFILPDDPKTKLAFIAGGIGITPFGSMDKYIRDNKQKRDIKLIYTNRTKADIAHKEMKFKTFHLLTKKEGLLQGKMIKEWIPDYKNRLFYVSGPEQMVRAAEKILREIGVGRGKIKKDYFPGY